MRPYSDQSNFSSDVCGGDTGNGSYAAGFANRRDNSPVTVNPRL